MTLVGQLRNGGELKAMTARAEKNNPVLVFLCSCVLLL